ncbi:MAG: hypothetical protein WCP85_30960 [Mariniphaga sp.]
MAKQDCLPPVTIGGIKITTNLIDALAHLRDYTTKDMHFFTEQCLIISSIDIDYYGLERELFLIFRAMYGVLQALNEKQEGGDQ